MFEVTAGLSVASVFVKSFNGSAVKRDSLFKWLSSGQG